MNTRWILLAAAVTSILLFCRSLPAGEGAAQAVCQSIPTLVFYPKNMEASKEFYMKKLDFEQDYTFNKLVADGCKLHNHGVEIVLVHVIAAGTTTVEKFQVNIRTEKVDELYDLLKSRGVPIVKKPEDTEWGTRWFQIRDPDGLTIGFEELKPKKE